MLEYWEIEEKNYSIVEKFTADKYGRTQLEREMDGISAQTNPQEVSYAIKALSQNKQNAWIR